jgi:hypothetical protein
MDITSTKINLSKRNNKKDFGDNFKEIFSKGYFVELYLWLFYPWWPPEVLGVERTD